MGRQAYSLACSNDECRDRSDQSIGDFGITLIFDAGLFPANRADNALGAVDRLFPDLNLFGDTRPFLDIDLFAMYRNLDRPTIEVGLIVGDVHSALPVEDNAGWDRDLAVPLARRLDDAFPGPAPLVMMNGFTT